MFVIPMAGMSSRFFDAGYEVPKYMLEAQGESLFAISVRSFERYFATEEFLFITLPDFDTPDFVRSECKRLGIAHASVVTLDKVTRGQAETVHLGIEIAHVSPQPITIFNIDTAMPGFWQPDFIAECDGYLDVFIGSGPNWSYARPAAPDSNRVAETAEKNPISDLCSTGLYHFRDSGEFARAFLSQADMNPTQLTNRELYIAPLYNDLIQSGLDIRYRVVETEDVIFFGVPDEYLALRAAPALYR